MNAFASDTGVTVPQQIRWGDLDALGHVNNIIFFQFAESARMAYFDAISLGDFKEQPTDGPGMVSANMNFRRQLKYPGTVHVAAHVTRIGEKSFTMKYTLRDAADDFVVADGEGVMVWVDYAAGRARPLPPALVDRIIQLERNPGLRPETRGT